MSERIAVIDLTPCIDDCWVCEREVIASSAGPNYGVPIYEGYIVPDDYRGEWGGFTACKPCYALVRLLQSERPGQLIGRSEVRRELGLS